MQTKPFVWKLWTTVGIFTFASTGTPFLAHLAVGTGAIATLALSAPVQAATLTNWQFDPTTQQLTITVPEGTTPRYFLLAEPARIVLDLPNTQIGAVPLEQAYSGAVRQIRIAQFQPDLARIVIELAPGVMLAPEQAELERVGSGAGANQTGDRWTLRPLLTDATETASAPPPASSDPAPAPEATAPETPAEPSSSAVPPSVTSNLPPLEPNAVEIPIEQPPTANTPPVANPPRAVESVREQVSRENREQIDRADEVEQDAEPEAIATPELPESVAAANTNPSESETAPPEASPPRPTAEETPPAAAPADEDETNSDNQAVDDADAEEETEPEEAETEEAEEEASTPAPVAQIPTELPPASFNGTDRRATVSVPPLGRNSAEATQPAELPPATTSPPTNPSANQSSRVSVPPLQPTAPPVEAASPARPQPAPDRESATAIEFGQPLPSQSELAIAPESTRSSTPEAVAVAPTGNILVPSGTVLSLRYPGESALELSNQEPRQEVLLLAQSVVDSTGNVILPQGSEVLGRFETGGEGSKFITQAISVQGRNVLLKAESAVLQGDRASDNTLIRNSALGALAGAILGGVGVGLVGGAAAGATTYLTSVQPATIQPNQVLEVRLLEDLLRQ
jgi:hypothetical protein